MNKNIVVKKSFSVASKIDSNLIEAFGITNLYNNKVICENSEGLINLLLEYIYQNSQNKEPTESNFK